MGLAVLLICSGLILSKSSFVKNSNLEYLNDGSGSAKCLLDFIDSSILCLNFFSSKLDLFLSVAYFLINDGDDCFFDSFSSLFLALR